MATSALDKLRKLQEPKIEHLPDTLSSWGPPGASMVISTPAEVDELIRTIPKGKIATINTLREALAKRHRTVIACPITTGIFANISMKAAFEEEAMGKKRVAPWWRVIKSDGKLNEKTVGGVAEHKRRLADENWTFSAAGKSNFRVVDYEKRLATLC